ncbi:MAG: hypothetical protein ABR597_10125 [Bacteroidales bacterium]
MKKKYKLPFYFMVVLSIISIVIHLIKGTEVPHTEPIFFAIIVMGLLAKFKQKTIKGIDSIVILMYFVGILLLGAIIYMLLKN